MKRRVFFTTLLSAGIAVLISLLSIPNLNAADEKKAAAESKPRPQGEVLKIPLRVMQLPDPKSTDTNTKVQLEILREFRKLYPEIELSPFSGIEIQNIGAESRLMLAIAGGAAPDVINVNFRMSDTYIQQNFLWPLDKYIESDPEFKSIDSFLNSLPPAIRPIVFREGPAVGGLAAGKHVWAVGNKILVRALFWRKDIFQDAGLDPEKPPKNWDELIEYARRIADPARDKYGISMAGGAQSSWDFMSYLWSAGADAVTQDKKTGEWRAAFGTREAAVALDFYMRLATERWQDSDGTVQHGYSTLNSDERSVKLAQQAGKLGMYSQYLGDDRMGGEVDPALVGIAPFPAGPSGRGATEINATLNGIFAGIVGRNNSEGKFVPAEKIRDAAWKYISFMNSKRARKIYAETMVNLGQGRSLSPTYLREFGYTESLKYFPPSWEQAFNQALENGKPEPYGRNCQMVYIYLTQPIDEAMQLFRDGKLPEGDSPEAKEKRLDMLQEILKKAENRTNARMIGHIEPQEQQKRTTVAIIVAIIIACVFCFVIYNIWKVFSPKDSYSGKKRGWDFKRNWLGYLIMIPALVSILLWTYYPMLTGSQLFFQDYRVVGDSRWVGFDNLAGVLFSDEWWSAIWNTFRYMMFTLTLGFLAPIVLAILLQEVSHGKIVYRTLYYLPAVMSGLVVIFMWKLFYQAGSSGILNQTLNSLASLCGLEFTPQDWLNDAKWAMLACVIPTIWAGAGPGCLIYLAALKGVPEETYEAAEIDGANFFQKIWHVTFPTLKALIIINFVGAFIASAQSGGMILIMTFGRANTEVAELHIFKEAYTNLQFGSAISMAWVLGMMTLMFTIYNLKRLSKMEFKTTGK